MAEKKPKKKKDDKDKNQAAVSLGKLGGVKGGPARAKALKPARRTESASKAACARWYGKQSCPKKKGEK
jgi:hypothetical protein